MGRTTRRRRRKDIKHCSIVSLETDTVIISLKKWMKTQGWYNETKLQLKQFPFSGRGITSLKTIHENGVLIRIPFHLLITFQTVICTDIITKCSTTCLRVHDYLSLFIINEKHKADGSAWTDYIKSLPLEVPNLPWLCPREEIEFFPEEMRRAVDKCRSDFKESWLRVRESIRTDWTCCCCGQKLDCVFNEDTFTWAYILVNSRAVYVDPLVVRELCDCPLGTMVSDEPSMALCPYLDMFNHSCDTGTYCDIEDCDGDKFYILKTRSTQKRYNQLFVSYGLHDNLKLLLEYGFFITGNPNDTISFNFQEVLNILNLKLNQIQYAFVKAHSLTEDLFIKNTGSSFNLTALIFVGVNSEIRNYSKYVYSCLEDSDFVDALYNHLHSLLSSRLGLFIKEYSVFNENVTENCRTRLVSNYLQCRINTVEEFLKVFSVKMK